MFGYPGFMVWWSVLGLVCMFLFWAVIVWVIKEFSGNRGEGSPKEKKPIEIAQKRLARGDISKELFDELRETLR